MKWGNCKNRICKRFRKLYKSKHTGKYVCVPCHDKDPFYHKECFQCGQKRKVAMRIIQKTYYKKCPTCCKKGLVTDKLCHFCMEQKPIEKKLIQYFCANCSVKHDYRKELCSMCGRKRHVHARTKFDEALCDSCYNENNQDICAKCGYPERIAARTEDGKHIGINCWQKERRRQKKLLVH